MKSSPHTTTETRAFARVIGPFVVIITATAIARAGSLRTLLADFRASSVWPWVTGIFVLLIGLVVVALHQHWRGAPAIIVSVLGWLTALKGFLLMALPQSYMGFAYSAVDAIMWWRVGFVAVALIGLYLTFVGWMPAAGKPAVQPARPPAGGTPRCLKTLSAGTRPRRLRVRPNTPRSAGRMSRYRAPRQRLRRSRIRPGRRTSTSSR